MIRQAKAPFIVALNKIDKPDSDVDMVKEQLKEEGVLLEEHGGEVQCVPISAKQVKISSCFFWTVDILDVSGFVVFSQ